MEHLGYLNTFYHCIWSTRFFLVQIHSLKASTSQTDRRILSRKIRIENSNQNRGPQFNLREVFKNNQPGFLKMPYLGGGFKHFLFSALFGEDTTNQIQICFHIFKRVQKNPPPLCFHKNRSCPRFSLHLLCSKVAPNSPNSPPLSLLSDRFTGTIWTDGSTAHLAGGSALFGRNLERLVHWRYVSFPKDPEPSLEEDWGFQSHP